MVRCGAPPMRATAAATTASAPASLPQAVIIPTDAAEPGSRIVPPSCLLSIFMPLIHTSTLFPSVADCGYFDSYSSSLLVPSYSGVLYYSAVAFVTEAIHLYLKYFCLLS